MKFKIPFRAIVAAFLTVFVCGSVIAAYSLKSIYGAIPVKLAAKLSEISRVVDSQYYFEADEGVVDNTALQTAVETAVEALDNADAADYEEGALDAYQTAIDAAQAVLDNANATQAEVDAAVDALADATTALDAAFVPLGYVSEDGLSNNNELSVEATKAWGGNIVLRSLTEMNDEFAFFRGSI